MRFFPWTNFSPLSLSPLLWLDGSDRDTLYDATTGGSLVAPDGTVARWQDKSGNANHATQGTSGQRPVLKTSIQNGRSAIRFDGTNDVMSYATAVFGNTSGRSVFAVLKNATIAASEYGIVIGSRNGTGTSIGCSTQVFPSSGFEPCTDVFAPGGMRYNSTGTAANANILGWHWSNWSTHKTNGDTRIRLNGTEVSGTAYGSNPSTFTTGTGLIGAFELTGSAAAFLLADIGEILVFPALTETERARVHAYLAAKWSI